MATNGTSDIHEALRSLERSVGAEFLRGRLADINAQIREREAYLDATYPTGKPRPSGEEDVTGVYRQEARIIENVLASAGSDDAIDLMDRQRRAREHWQYLENTADWPIRSESERRRRLAAWTEAEILADLLRQFEVWVRERMAAEASSRREV